MNALELKIPPVVLVLLAGALMWQLPFGQVIAAALAVAGGIVAILGGLALPLPDHA